MNIEINKRFLKYITDWEHYEYFLIGGYASSKSYNTAIKLILKVLKEKRKVLVVRDYYSTLKDSCYADLLEAIDVLGVQDHFIAKKQPLEIHARNGSVILFRGLDNYRKLKSIKGISIIWLEEGEGSREIYDELKDRMREKGKSSHIVVTSNPQPKRHWIYQRYITETGIDEEELYKKGVIEKDNIYIHHSTYQDNQFLNEQFIYNIENIADPVQRKIKKEGKFGVTGDKVFYNLETADAYYVEQEANKQTPRYRRTGFDFGFSVSYNAIVRTAIDPEKKILYIYDEYYKKGETNDEILLGITKYINDTIIADSAEPKTIAFFKKKGFYIKGAKKEKIIERVKKLRNFNKIIIANNCKNSFDELDMMTFDKDKWGEPIEDKFNIDSHVFDAVSYAIEYYNHIDLKSRGLRKPKGW